MKEQSLEGIPVLFTRDRKLPSFEGGVIVRFNGMLRPRQRKGARSCGLIKIESISELKSPRGAIRAGRKRDLFEIQVLLPPPEQRTSEILKEPGRLRAWLVRLLNEAIAERCSYDRFIWLGHERYGTIAALAALHSSEHCIGAIVSDPWPQSLMNCVVGVSSADSMSDAAHIVDWNEAFQLSDNDHRKKVTIIGSSTRGHTKQTTFSQLRGRLARLEAERMHLSAISQGWTPHGDITLIEVRKTTEGLKTALDAFSAIV